MSQNVPKCPFQTHRCPNGLVLWWANKISRNVTLTDLLFCVLKRNCLCATISHRGQIWHLKKTKGKKAHISIPYSSVTIMMMLTIVTSRLVEASGGRLNIDPLSVHLYVYPSCLAIENKRQSSNDQWAFETNLTGLDWMYHFNKANFWLNDNIQ